MNESRLLFEGLEDRILLNGDPTAAAAAVGATIQQESYAHTEVFVMADTNISFTLPKFDDQGGARTLVSVQLDGHVVILSGSLETRNANDFAGTLNELTLSLTVDASVAVTGTTTYTFDPGVLSKSLSENPIAIGPAPDTSNLNWIPEGDPPDMYTVNIAGTSGDLTQVVVSNTADLADFIQSPGDTTIQYDASSATGAIVDFVGVILQSRTNPAIQYTMTGSVTYFWTEGRRFPPYTDETYRGPMLPEFEPRTPPVTQPFFSGTAQPGATLAVDILGAGGEVLGSTSTLVDASGNWTASFYDTNMTGQPSTLSIRQSQAGYTPLFGSGYNLRRYYSPAMLGGAYASEVLTVNNVLGKRATTVAMSALYSVSANPITAQGLAPYAFEMLPMAATPQGLY